ncbi:MAG: copper-binding protein [Hydrogenophaga sp.]|nr:copper-binding protein [Hydrogenophaga sp.]
MHPNTPENPMPQHATHRRPGLVTGLAAIVLIGSTAIAHSQTAAPAPASPAVSTAASPPLVEAEVRKVDLRAGKVTLKHGDIPNLDMPPMTMVFQVQDPALLDQLKPGDKIRFRVDKLSGSYTVIELQRDAAHTPTN